MKRLKIQTCRWFGHQWIMYSPAPLMTYIGCKRCEIGRQYTFTVEDSFFEGHGLPEPGSAQSSD